MLHAIAKQPCPRCDEQLSHVRQPDHSTELVCVHCGHSPPTTLLSSVAANQLDEYARDHPSQRTAARQHQIDHAAQDAREGHSINQTPHAAAPTPAR